MRDINLLQSLHSEKKQFDIAQFVKFALVGLVVLVVLLGGCYGALLYGVAQSNGEIARLSAEATEYIEVTEVKGSIALMQTQLESLQTLLDTAAVTSPVEGALLDTLASALGGEIYFTNLAVGENGTVSISGSAAARDEVTNLLYNLKITGRFSHVSVNLVNAGMQESGTAQTYDFTLNATLKGEEAGE